MRKGFAIVKTYWQNLAEYRLDSFIYTLGSVIFPVIMLSVWLKVGQSGTGLPYTPNELVTYYLALSFTGMITAAWLAWVIDEQVRNGQLSPYLLKPVSYVLFLAADTIAEKVFRLLYIVPMIVLLAVFFHAHVLFSAGQLGLFLIALFLAAALASVFNVMLGLLCFWLADVRPVLSISNLLHTIFSGGIIPLAFFPGVLGLIAQWMPYRFMLSFPVEILVGKLSTEQVIMGFVWQGGWLIFSMCGYQLLWRLGIREYQAVGS